MAHYAILDENNIVTNVIVGKDENDDIDWEQHYSSVVGRVCKRTSYNTQAGVHKQGGIPFRKNYACIGYSYDTVKDAFIPPKPPGIYVLDESTCTWTRPIPYPSDGNNYLWNDSTESWEPMTDPGST